VRMLRRTPEIATRLALGASRWQIHRQLWIENLLRALVEGAAGIGVGFVTVRGLLLLLPEHFLPVANVPLDGRVLGFTLSLSLLTSVLFGMLPTLAARKVDLLIRTLIHLETMPPGFNATGVITAKASLDNVLYHDPAAFRKLLNESLGAMREIPGVHNAAFGLTLPYERALLRSAALSDGKEAGKEVMTNQVYVTPGFSTPCRFRCWRAEGSPMPTARMRSMWSSSTGHSHASSSMGRIPWGDISTRICRSWFGGGHR
jgi:hypothetical protein